MNARSNYVSVPAVYRSTGVRDFDGNPFIEALPPMEASKNAIIERLENYPAVPTAKDRKLGELVRIAELGRLRSLVYPLAEYKRAGTHLTLNIRETYVARNPLASVDMQRRLALATDSKEYPFPLNWKSSAKGQSLIGISGSGKTTFATAFSLPYMIVIEHREYKGRPFVCRQIPWVNLRMAHDATLKSLCLQFFEEVDSILGNTNYRRQAESIRGIARMSLLMAHVATVASIAVIFVDELQNLKAAKGGNAVFVLNLFSEIIERAGVTLVIAGTPALESVIDENVRNLRKLNSGGASYFERFTMEEPEEFDEFCNRYWDYQFVKNPVPLSAGIRKAWFEAGGGNQAFTALAFMLANRNEIGGREVIDEAAFQRVSKFDMAILQPAITALRIGTTEALMHFDDLLSGTSSLREFIERNAGKKSVSGAGEDISEEECEEFDEMQETAAESEKKMNTQKGKKSTESKGKKYISPVSLPVETPI